MVCFELEVSLILHQRSNEAALDRQIQHLVRHCNADLRNFTQTVGAMDYSIRVCDQSAASLLRDFPTPFNVKKITLMRTGEILYLHRKHSMPPRIPLLKDIYWLAKSTERWKVQV
jgi:hypothetical protein